LVWQINIVIAALFCIVSLRQLREKGEFLVEQEVPSRDVTRGQGN
jgi:hypothetical protein